MFYSGVTFLCPQGSFDDALHFEEIVTPLRSDIFKGKNAQITTSNLAQLAMSTLGVTERIEDVKAFVVTPILIVPLMHFLSENRNEKN